MVKMHKYIKMHNEVQKRAKFHPRAQAKQKAKQEVEISGSVAQDLTRRWPSAW